MHWRCAVVKLLLALCVLAVVPANAAQLQFDQTDLTPAERAASASLLKEALHRLPPRWRQTLDARLQLRWSDDLPSDVHGRTQAGRISLRRDLLRQLPHQSLEDTPALRALLHELAHVYDRSPQGGLSHNPHLLDLAGWQQRPLHFGRRSAHNPFTGRSPDEYELTNPREYVAVNLEWFLLDPEYACRRPALARLFAAHFNWQPAAAACAPGLVFMRAEGRTGQLEQLDPKRVYAVDYLLAEGNAAPMSRWGHSMLRLVICAPGRAPGPDCRLDLQYHRVLSFRAFVEDVQISSLRGLTGRYPSRLFLLPLDQVIDEYTKTELRGLQSLPLRMTQEEISALLTRAAQLHWSYDGRYYFVSNNCAVETWKLLHDALPRYARAHLRSVFPRRLLRRLARAGLVETAVLEDRAAAVRQGYYFEPMDAHYQALFTVAHEVLRLPQVRVEEWLALSPMQRAPWLGRGDLRATAALLVLEEAAQRRAELRARDVLKRRLLDARVDDGARTQVRSVLAKTALLMWPASLDGGGYGLPQQERAVLEAQARALAGQTETAWAELWEQAQAALPAREQVQLAGVTQNLEVLGARLRVLADKPQ